ncbi:hypothetical protein BKA16_000235 [Gordonia humi]|uniref:Uncharacterized protein n=1 Tax=Gordonia humi TaxID=686429 RepID=A0A840ETT2_9ACTN|nr:hypothetical protein [Gordonia humi]
MADAVMVLVGGGAITALVLVVHALDRRSSR